MKNAAEKEGDFRPCREGHPVPIDDRSVCGVCWAYLHDPAYRKLYSQARPPRPAAAGKPVPVRASPGTAAQLQPPRDMTQCVHLGEPTGEVRAVQSGMG